MILKQFLKTLTLNFTRSIHIHKEMIKGEKPGAIIIAHGMLGSSGNWSSLSRRIAKETGKSVVTFDARNHGQSEHTETMNYPQMSEDMRSLIQNDEKCTLIGHSMGGRTAMYLALTNPSLVEKLVVVDVSPENIEFDVTDSTQWNMAHFFYAMKAVEFPQDTTVFKARKAADVQLSKRISDPGLRAWLLMNVYQNSDGIIGWRVNLDVILEAFLTHIRHFPNEDFAEKNVQYNGPTIFIGGASSDYIPVSDHPDILEKFPSAKFEYIQGAGHWVHSQKPNEFLEVLLKFLLKS